MINKLRDEDSELASAIGSPTLVNGTGHKKHCAHLREMLQILWMLPRNAHTRAFRNKCATDIVRQMQGDLTMIEELERNKATLEETSGLHFYENRAAAVTNGVPSMDQVFGGPLEARLSPVVVSEADRIDLEERQLEIRERERRLDPDDHTLCRDERRQCLDERRQCLDERRHRLLRERIEMEEAILALTVSHATGQQHRMRIFSELGLLDDVKRFSIADSVQNYNPRKHVLDVMLIEGEPSVNESILGSKPSVAEDESELTQVAEILEQFMDADKITKSIAQQAGSLVAAEYRERFGADVKFDSGYQRIDGRKCQVKAYQKKHLSWILALLKTKYN
jgi:hypothetical protein